jgi:methanogenic corrinoid protein MtbC1
MEELLQQIAECIEFGKINLASPYPPNMKGQDGADELTKKALDMGVAPQDILNNSLIVGMSKIGVKFRENKVFVPQVLMSAKAMNTAMIHLKPFFNSGAVQRKGVFILGTVEGDLHDIGKNLVAMMVEGSGFEVIDLGVDVKIEKFKEALDQHPNAFVGLSALLTTTMAAMDRTNKELKEAYPAIKTFIGGAPVSDQFRAQIGADFYSADPQGLVEILNGLVA